MSQGGIQIPKMEGDNGRESSSRSIRELQIACIKLTDPGISEELLLTVPLKVANLVLERRKKECESI